MGNAGSGPAAGVEVPEKMKAVRMRKFVEKHSSSAEDYADVFGVDEIDTPKPRPGQILVRMDASPINPSDLSMIAGTYNAKQREELPCQVGFEGVGTVVASGGGYGYMLLGKRVAIASRGGGRMWSEYAVANAMEAVTLPDEATAEAARGGVFVNPLTCIAFSEIAKAGKHKAVVLTASGSALGKMTIKYLAEQGVGAVSVVRRAAQREELLAIGARAVVVTSEEGWEERFKEACKEHNAKLCFDAVAGGLTGDVLKAMPPGSEVRVYGGLSLEACANITPTDLIFADKSVRGFWLTSYLKTKSLLGLAGWMKTVQKKIGTSLNTKVRRVYPLEQAGRAVADYNSNMADGKICVGVVAEEEEGEEEEENVDGGAEEKEEEEEEEKQ